MTIFISQRPNNDPAPYVVTLTKRTPFSNPMSTGSMDEFVREESRVRDPRPEFDHTRDPEPVVDSRTGIRHVGGNCYFGERPTCQWAPRHEQFDVPVNRVLAAYREYVGNFGDDDRSEAERRLEELSTLDWSSIPAFEPTPEELDHARRVLAKLVGVFS